MRFLIFMLLVWIPYSTLLGANCLDLESLQKVKTLLREHCTKFPNTIIRGRHD